MKCNTVSDNMPRLKVCHNCALAAINTLICDNVARWTVGVGVVFIVIQTSPCGESPATG